MEKKTAKINLRFLREAVGKTQKELACIMGTTQASISRLENGRNLKLSSVIRYVNALGGTLEVIAEFPNPTRRFIIVRR